jgi:hypothetical protein
MTETSQAASARARAKAAFLNQSERADRLQRRHDARAAARDVAARCNAVSFVVQPIGEDTFDEAANASASDRLLATLRQHHVSGEVRSGL